MTKAEARMLETLANDAWIALAHSDGDGAGALATILGRELDTMWAKAKLTVGDVGDFKIALSDLKKRIAVAAQIVSRIREAAREELKE